MKRLLAVVLVAAAMGGCTPYYSGYGYGPTTVSVGMAPPPPQYEMPIACGYGSAWEGGYWDWSGSWYWRPGYCMAGQPGYAFVRPYWSGGVYYRGYWRQGGPTVVAAPPPAPVYGRPGVVVQPPPPAYRPGGVVVQPPPGPVYGRPVGGPTVVGAPPPAYRPGGMAPPPPPAYRPGGMAPPPPPPRGGVVVGPPPPVRR
jgi:hypothetical protein